MASEASLNFGVFYRPGRSGATCPSAAHQPIPGGRGGNAAEDGAAAGWEEPDLHPRPTLPSTHERRPLFRRRSQRDAEAFGAVRPSFQRSLCRTVGLSCNYNGYSKNKRYFSKRLVLINIVIAQEGAQSPGRQENAHFSCLKTHQTGPVSWISPDFFLTCRNFQRKNTKRVINPSQHTDSLHVQLWSCGFVSRILARFAFSWINNSACHPILRLDLGPGNLVTHKPPRGTVGMAVAPSQGCSAVPATTHNSLPSISASCSAFSIDRYLYIILGCNKCLGDLHCNFNHKL